MRERQFLFLALAGLMLMGFAPGAQGAAPVQVRVGELGRDIGRTVTVVGRTGYIVTKFQDQGLHVFTLRDDYNDQVMVRTIGDTYPVMGTTYRITGSPTRQGKDLFLDSAPDMISPVYPITAPALPPSPPSLQSQILLWSQTLLSGLAILLVLGYVLIRWLNRPMPEWGVLSVTSGPDRGLNVPLHRRRIAIGRGVNPTQDIRLSGGDQTISNRHALLEYRGGRLYICDMSSNGTRIGGEKLTLDKPLRVNSGDLIHLGTRGTVVIVRLHSSPPHSALLGSLREPAPLTNKTIMLGETPAEEPAWKSVTAEVEPPPAGDVAGRQPTEPLPMDAEAALPEERDRTELAEDEEDDEDDIPHTFVSPRVFTFAGHDPKPGRVFSDNGHEHERDADEAGTSTSSV